MASLSACARACKLAARCSLFSVSVDVKPDGQDELVSLKRDHSTYARPALLGQLTLHLIMKEALLAASSNAARCLSPPWLVSLFALLFTLRSLLRGLRCYSAGRIVAAHPDR